MKLNIAHFKELWNVCWSKYFLFYIQFFGSILILKDSCRFAAGTEKWWEVQTIELVLTNSLPYKMLSKWWFIAKICSLWTCLLLANRFKRTYNICPIYFSRHQKKVAEKSLFLESESRHEKKAINCWRCQHRIFIKPVEGD